MLRIATTLAPLVLIACAAVRTAPLGDAALPGELRDSYPALAAASPGAIAQAPPGQRRSGFTAKAGYYDPADGAFDDGSIVNLAWSQSVHEHFATEFEVGYLEADGSFPGGRTDLWGLPFMGNGRFNLLAGKIDIYGGLGIGTIYYDVEAASLFVSASTDGWLLAGNAFAGASLDVGDKVSLGLEGKYYVTEDIGNTDLDLDGFAVMLTLSLRM